MSLKTYRIHWKDGTTQLLIGTDLIESFGNSGISISRLLTDAEKYYPVVLIGVWESPDKIFVKELPFLLNECVEIVGKISAIRKGDCQVSVCSPNTIGVNLDVNGDEKIFLNGDLVIRRYKAFTLLEDAERWLNTPITFITAYKV
jgi:hypothetical protein